MKFFRIFKKILAYLGVFLFLYVVSFISIITSINKSEAEMRETNRKIAQLESMTPEAYYQNTRNDLYKEVARQTDSIKISRWIKEILLFGN